MTTNIPQALIDSLPEGVTIDDCTITTIAALESDYYDVDADAVQLADEAVVVVLPGWTADDGNAAVEYHGTDDRSEAAKQYVADGDWGDRDSTSWVTIYTWRTGLTLDGDGEVGTVAFDRESEKITIEAAEPDCKDDQMHDWCSPIEVVGGIAENPGVWGHGGGVQITEVCRHCGCYRETDTWAQDMSDGVQGLTSIEYRDADGESLAWIESLRETSEEE